jgi:4-diphosphocytidyl-2-C-methyl-D-erythritol kinase
MNPDLQPPLRLAAPAKINLFLHVLGRRPDGYHDLETWMQKLDLCDAITLQLRRDGRIGMVCSDGSLPADRSNLAWRAAEMFFAASERGRGSGVDIRLLKRIPMAAGLGGGSSDAGLVLRGLNSLFGEEFAGQGLLRMALGLGADVPFFATDHDAVLAGGVGEVMQPVPTLADCSFLLVNPGFSVSTRWVFENLALTRGYKKSKLTGFQKNSSGTLSLAGLTNDLEQVTLVKHPEIAVIKETLLAAGAKAALMSGSGPTVFGVFPDSSTNHAELQDIAEDLRRKFGERVFVTRAWGGASPSG